VGELVEAFVNFFLLLILHNHSQSFTIHESKDRVKHILSLTLSLGKNVLRLFSFK